MSESPYICRIASECVEVRKKGIEIAPAVERKIPKIMIIGTNLFLFHKTARRNGRKIIEIMMSGIGPAFQVEPFEACPNMYGTNI